jgi:hypothetical protein
MLFDALGVHQQEHHAENGSANASVHGHGVTVIAGAVVADRVTGS